MTRHDDRCRIFTHRLSDLPRQRLVAKSFRDLAISYGGARRDLADNRIDAPVEIRQSAVVDCNIGQVALFACKQRNDAVNCVLDVGCGRRFLSYRIPTAHTRARRRGISFRKLHPKDAARTPDDAARSDRCIKEREILFHHMTNITSVCQPAPPDSWSALLRKADSCTATKSISIRSR